MLGCRFCVSESIVHKRQDVEKSYRDDVLCVRLQYDHNRLGVEIFRQFICIRHIPK